MPKRPSKIDPKDSLLVEADLEKQIFDFLHERNWRIIRHRPRGLRGRQRMGEIGAADILAIRPASFGKLDGFFLELKRKGQKPNTEQTEWLAERIRERYKAIWCDSMKQFRAWYGRQYY